MVVETMAVLACTYGDVAYNVVLSVVFLTVRLFSCSSFDSDGRLTSSWNWTSRIAKKSYYHAFMLSGFQGFDGDFR